MSISEKKNRRCSKPQWTAIVTQAIVTLTQAIVTQASSLAENSKSD